METYYYTMLSECTVLLGTRYLGQLFHKNMCSYSRENFGRSWLPEICGKLLVRTYMMLVERIGHQMFGMIV